MSDKRTIEYLTTTRRNFLLGTTGAVLALGVLPGSLAFAADDAVTLRVAATGSNADSLDPHRTQGQITDIVRFMNIYDGLSEYNPDASVGLSLAESFTPNADSTEWTLKLKAGIKTHDGKDFGADDIIFSVKRILDKEHPTKGSALISFIDPANVTKVDAATVLFKLKDPYGPFPDVWANRYLRMVPVGFDPAKPVGTRAFK